MFHNAFSVVFQKLITDDDHMRVNIAKDPPDCTTNRLIPKFNLIEYKNFAHDEKAEKCVVESKACSEHRLKSKRDAYFIEHL